MCEEGATKGMKAKGLNESQEHRAVETGMDVGNQVLQSAAYMPSYQTESILKEKQKPNKLPDNTNSNPTRQQTVLWLLEWVERDRPKSRSRAL